ncbi:alpha/beta fold hydrolase [Candidatus Acetothermia bacterium]|nr:alpha/beta fold hydrolase [Candidatus Acetothermia bacterium]
MSNVWIYVGIVGVSLISGLAVAGWIGTDMVVGNHPEWRKFTATPEDYRLPVNVVEFTSTDGIKLKAWWFPAQGTSRATVLLAHGNQSNRSRLLSRAAFLVKNGYNVLAIDLRAHGESEGNYQTPGYFEARDLLGAVRYVREVLKLKEPIVAFGHSYGGVAAIHAAVQSPEISAVIADSAFMSFQDLLTRYQKLTLDSPKAPFWAKVGMSLMQFPPVSAAMGVILYLRTGVTFDQTQADALPQIPKLGNKPILFIAGDQDQVAPLENTQKMYEAARSPKKQLWIAKGASHNTTYSTVPEEYEATVLKFLEDVFQSH